MRHGRPTFPVSTWGWGRSLAGLGLTTEQERLYSSLLSGWAPARRADFAWGLPGGAGPPGGQSSPAAASRYAVIGS